MMVMMLRRAPTLVLRSLINNVNNNVYACTSAAADAFAAGDLKLLRGAPYSTTAAENSSRTSRFVPLGIAGALSFSLALSTVAEAKAAPPSPDLLPKEVVLYQYEACPFCNKVKGN